MKVNCTICFIFYRQLKYVIPIVLLQFNEEGAEGVRLLMGVKSILKKLIILAY